MNDIQRKIIVQLMYNDTVSFNELWKKTDCQSNTFAYHMKQLEEEGIIQKKESLYSLTTQGKSICTYMNGETGNKTKQPLSVVILGVFNSEGNILLMKRSKEPFKGLWGLPGGKIEFSDFISKTAHKELKEETGLTGDITLCGINHIHTYENDQLIHSHILYDVRVDNPIGTIDTNNREGELKWFAVDSINSVEYIADLPIHLQLFSEKKFVVNEIKRIIKDGKIISIEVINSL